MNAPLQRKKKRRLPRRLHQPAGWAMRGLLGSLLIPGASPVVESAGALGHAFARSPINKRRLQQICHHLEVAFPEWDAEHRHRVALGSLKHLFKLAAEVAYTPRLLTDQGWQRHVHIGDLDEALVEMLHAGPCLLVTGHNGNWELLGYTMALLGVPLHALYRPLDLKPLDGWVRTTRSRRGLVLVDKFGAAQQLPKLLDRGAPIGFVADQNGGDRGLFVPFFNRLASTYKSVGLLAMQYKAPLICGCAVRLDPGTPTPDGQRWSNISKHASLRYSIRIQDIIKPEHWIDQPDPLFYITARYRYAIEQMVRQTPEQYFWMHRVWKSRPRHEKLNRPFPAALRKKLESLDWLSSQNVDQLVEQSERDARTLKRLGTDRL